MCLPCAGVILGPHDKSVIYRLLVGDVDFLALQQVTDLLRWQQQVLLVLHHIHKVLLQKQAGNGHLSNV